MYKTILIVLVVLAVSVIALGCGDRYGVYLGTPGEFYYYIQEHPGISWKDLDARSPLHWNREGGGEFNIILDDLVENGRIRVVNKTGPNTGNYFIND